MGPCTRDFLFARVQVRDDVGAILPGYTWKDTMAMGDRDCEYYRARPHACRVTSRAVSRMRLSGRCFRMSK